MKAVSRNITLFWLNLRKELDVSLNYGKEIKRNKRNIKRRNTRNRTSKPFDYFRVLQG